MSQTEVRDELPVPLDVPTLHVFEKAAPPPDHLEQALAAVMILLVLVEMGPEIVDASREDRDLDGGAPTIAVVELVLLDDVFLDDRHRRRASSRVGCCKGSENRMPLQRAHFVISLTS